MYSQYSHTHSHIQTLVLHYCYIIMIIIFPSQPSHSSHTALFSPDECIIFKCDTISMQPHPSLPFCSPMTLTRDASQSVLSWHKATVGQETIHPWIHMHTLSFYVHTHTYIHVDTYVNLDHEARDTFPHLASHLATGSTHPKSKMLSDLCGHTVVHTPDPGAGIHT